MAWKNSQDLRTDRNELLGACCFCFCCSCVSPSRSKRKKSISCFCSLLLHPYRSPNFTFWNLTVESSREIWHECSCCSSAVSSSLQLCCYSRVVVSHLVVGGILEALLRCVVEAYAFHLWSLGPPPRDRCNTERSSAFTQNPYWQVPGLGPTRMITARRSMEEGGLPVFKPQSSWLK